MPPLELRRTVRFCINDDPDGPGGPGGEGRGHVAPRDNTYSSWPPMRGLGRYYELDVCCRGRADPVTGYFINIKHIDRAVRDAVLPGLGAAAERGSDAALGAVLAEALSSLQPLLGDSVHEVTLHLTPFYAIAMQADQPRRVLIRQQYEFSAAHRLHAAALSDERNRAVFGKCNNPAGHGHNYRVEAVASVPVDASGQIPAVERLDALVREHVIDVLDHRNLNEDVPQFKNVNPSVENISVVVWELLSGAVSASIAGARLVEVSVWETEKTLCTYRGPGWTPSDGQ